jgi:hypothetical protein
VRPDDIGHAVATLAAAAALALPPLVALALILG